MADHPVEQVPTFGGDYPNVIRHLVVDHDVAETVLPYMIAENVALHRRIHETEICPACGRNEIDTPSGFCSGCVVARASENYAANDRSLRDERSRDWRVRTTDTTGPRWDALRQQRRRQVRAVRPTRPAASLDPWGLAIDALSICRRVAHARPGVRAELDEVMETLRRLAWGPDEGEEWIAKAPAKHRRQIPGQLTLFDLEAVIAA